MRPKRELDALLLVGQQMASACFDLSQRQGLEERERQLLRELCGKWDNGLRAYKALTKKPRKAK